MTTTATTAKEAKNAKPEGPAGAEWDWWLKACREYCREHGIELDGAKLEEAGKLFNRWKTPLAAANIIAAG
jgi:hypothetical protein